MIISFRIKSSKYSNFHMIREHKLITNQWFLLCDNLTFSKIIKLKIEAFLRPALGWNSKKQKKALSSVDLVTKATTSTYFLRENALFGCLCPHRQFEAYWVSSCKWCITISMLVTKRLNQQIFQFKLKTWNGSLSKLWAKSIHLF